MTKENCKRKFKKKCIFSSDNLWKFYSLIIATMVKLYSYYRSFFCRVTLCNARPVPSCGVRPSVCLSVCHVRVLYRNKQTYPKTFSTIW